MPINFKGGLLVNGENVTTETVVETLQEELDNKADVDGNYPTLTVGNADQLNSPDFTTDQAPYLYRTSGGDADIGNREKDTIVGGSLGWNQFVDMLDAEGGTSCGVAFTCHSNNTIVANGTSTGAAENQRYRNTNERSINITKGHKYLYLFNWKNVPSTGTVVFVIGGSGSGLPYDEVRPTISGLIKEATASSTEKPYSILRISSGTTVNNLSIQFHLFDLTACFGPTIADYIYSLEQATAGAGVAWFRKLFPKPYYPYKAIGGFLHVKLTSHDMVHFNQFDNSRFVKGRTENGNVSYAGDTSAMTITKTGVTFTTTVNWRGVCGGIEGTVPNAEYYANFVSNNNLVRCYIDFYDADMNWISKPSVPSDTHKITSPSNARYHRLSFQIAQAGSAVITDVNLNLSWSGWRNGQFEAYKKNSYPLDTSVILRGIPKLDADNNLYYDGDKYHNDGTVEEIWGEKTLDGTETWTLETVNTDAGYVEGYVFAIPKKPGYKNFRCLQLRTGNTLLDVNSCIGREANAAISICVPTSVAGTTQSEFQTYARSLHLTFVFEKSVATTSQADPFQETQEVDDFGTEEYVVPEQNGVSVPVGHYTEYPENLRDKLRRLPNMPTVSETTTATYAVNYNGQTKKCSFVPINDWLVANGYPTANVLASKAALGGTLRQLLAVSKTLDFANTAFVDLGELNWGYSTTEQRFYAFVSGAKFSNVDNAVTTNVLLTSDYSWTSMYAMTHNSAQNMSIAGYQTQITIKNTSYTDTTVFKATMKGQLLAYEKD